jgi:hypothetical protein
MHGSEMMVELELGLMRIPLFGAMLHVARLSQRDFRLSVFLCCCILHLTLYSLSVLLVTASRQRGKSRTSWTLASGPGG